MRVYYRTKIMKGPWTHYPDAKPLLFVLERCSACCMLIDRVSATHVPHIPLQNMALTAKPIQGSRTPFGYIRVRSPFRVSGEDLTSTPFRSFTLMMQTGAFLQMILVLAAIASRMRLLLLEVRSALEISWSASYRALQTTSVRPLRAHDPTVEC